MRGWDERVPGWLRLCVGCPCYVGCIIKDS